MSVVELPTTPYKGLVPYSEEDASFFFGRETETEIIAGNLRASRLTLLYGASGVGKTSVLRAGVVHQLRQLARKNLAKRGAAELGVVVFGAWRDDPVVMLEKSIDEQLSWLRIPSEEIPFFAPTFFLEFLQKWSTLINGDLLVILDQFEEYFLYHAQEDGPGAFAYELPRAVNRSDLRVNFLISMREDALAKLDRFKGRIPNLFDNYLRIEHLDLIAAREAIVKPIQQYNRAYPTEPPVNIEPELVDGVLAQVKTGELVLGDVGHGGVKEGVSVSQIETPYLQLVMTRLWDEELRAGSRVLQLATLNKLGGAEKIVRTHLNAVMGALNQSEQDIAAKAFRFLVTPSGTKIAYTISDLSKIADLDETQLAPTLDKLAGSDLRILRPVTSSLDRSAVPRYEIFHDVLAPAVLEWRNQYVRTQLQLENERKQSQERANAQKRIAEERQRASRFAWALVGLKFRLWGNLDLH